MDIFRWFRHKQDFISQSLAILYGTNAKEMPINYEGYAKYGYQQNPYVFSAIRVFTNAAKSIKLLLYERVGEKLIEVEDKNNPIFKLIRRPNKNMSFPVFLENVVGYYGIAGNSFIFGNRIGKDAIFKELTSLRPDRVKIVPDALGDVARYEYLFQSDQGQAFKKQIAKEDMLHLKTFHPTDDYFGLSPISVVAKSIDQNNAGRSWNAKMLENGAKPSGILKATGSLTEQQVSRLKQQVEENIQGEKNAGRPMILEGGLTWEAISVSPKEMDYIEGSKQSAREISIAQGVAPELMGDSSQKTYSNYKEARKALYEETVLPFIDVFVEELNVWMVWPFAKSVGREFVLAYDKDSIEALSESRTTLFTTLGGVDYLTDNEKRNLTGYDDLPGGNKIYKPLGMMPVASEPKASQENEPDINPTDEDSEVSGATGNNKSFNISGEDNVRMYWKRFDAGREAWYNGVESKVKDLFREERKTVLKAIGQASDAGELSDRIDTAIDSKSEAWNRLMATIYLAVGDSFATSVYGNLKSCYGFHEHKAEGEEIGVGVGRVIPATPLARDVWMDAIEKYVKKNGASKVVEINDTTRNQLKDIVAEGIENGDSLRNIEKQIDDLYLEQIIPNRSITIARTEVISASNLGSREAAKATGLPLKKKWLATNDDRTREDHDVADGQLQDIDEAYSVGGEKMMFPGDSSLGAGAGNVINCRCAELYVTVPKP